MDPQNRLEAQQLDVGTGTGVEKYVDHHVKLNHL
jgi:hypothetical protein